MTYLSRQSVAALIAVIGVAMPASSQTATVPPRPTPGPAKPFTFPRIVTQTLPNGLRLAVIENHELPLVAVRFGFLGGPFLDPPGKEGNWELMLSALREGTMMRSSTSIAETAADLGTTMSWSSIGTQPSAGAPSFTTIKSAWQPALNLVAEMLMYPSFPPDAVDRLQAAQLNAAAHPSPFTLYGLRTVTPILYGRDHLYTRTLFSTDSSVRRLTHEDVVAMYAAYMRPQNTVLVIAGDVTPAEARAAVDNALGSWQRTEKVIVSKVQPATSQASPTTIYLRDVPNTPQSFVMFGASIPSHTSPDAPAIEIVNAILAGASAGSRMFDALRTKRGLSYASPGGLLWRPEPQPANWLVFALVPAAKTDTAVTEMIRVFRETHGDRPITEEELDFSRRNLTRNLPAQLETVDALATNALGLVKFDLPTTFTADNLARMNALTLDDVRAAAAKYIDPEHLIIAVVGDRAKLEAPLRATGIPVVVVDH